LHRARTPGRLKVGIQIWSAVEHIPDCFSQPASLVVIRQPFQPTPEGGQDRRRFLQTIFISLFVIVEMFSAIMLNFKELIAIDHVLNGGMGIVQYIGSIGEFHHDRTIEK